MNTQILFLKCQQFIYRQGSLFSKAYHLLAQQYFSAGPLPPSLLHPLFGGPLLEGGPLPCSLLGGSTSMFISGGSTSMFTSGGSTSVFTLGGPLLCHFQGVHFHSHFWGLHFCVHFYVTYPIMLLYTAIERPSASWEKFTWDPPEFNRLTDKHL